jgi:hypothetical protein
MGASLKVKVLRARDLLGSIDHRLRRRAARPWRLYRIRSQPDKLHVVLRGLMASFTVSIHFSVM